MYFADVSTKSLAHAHPQGNLAMLLLFEVALGKSNKGLRFDGRDADGRCDHRSGHSSIHAVGLQAPDSTWVHIM